MGEQKQRKTFPFLSEPTLPSRTFGGKRNILQLTFTKARPCAKNNNKKEREKKKKQKPTDGNEDEKKPTMKYDAFVFITSGRNQRKSFLNQTRKKRFSSQLLWKRNEKNVK